MSEADRIHCAVPMGGNRAAVAGNPVHTAEPSPLLLMLAADSRAAAADSKAAAVVVVGSRAAVVAVN